MDQDSKGVQNAGLLEGLQRMRSEKAAQGAYAEGIIACVLRINQWLENALSDGSAVIGCAALSGLLTSIEKEAKGVIGSTSKDVEVLTRSVQALSLENSRDQIGQLLNTMLARIPGAARPEHANGLFAVPPKEESPQTGDLEPSRALQLEEEIANG